MMPAIAALVALSAAVLVAQPGTAAAQTASALDRYVSFPVTPVPFGVGERMEYKVSYGVFGGVGNGSIEVAAVDTMHGHPSYRIEMRLKGGVLFAKVNDVSQSWLDVDQLFSRRFDQNVHQVRYKRHRIIDFLPDRGIWQRVNKDESGPLATRQPLDDLSFLYHVRTIPLEVGQSYTIPRYYKDEGNPVILQVLRREEVTIPAGTFRTIVVRPIIKTDGMFSEGGEAEVFLTDDELRLPVQLKTKLSIGTINLELISWTPGTRLVSRDTSRASGQ
jgi:hypothetical protein